MTVDSSAPEPTGNDRALTPVEQAIRTRALQRIRDEQARPKPSWQRRLLIGTLTLIAVTTVVLMLNFVVTGMHRIMDIWYPGSISGRVPPPTPQVRLDQPFMIGVVSEPTASASSSTAKSSVESAAKTTDASSSVTR